MDRRLQSNATIAEVRFSFGSAIPEGEVDSRSSSTCGVIDLGTAKYNK